MERPELSDAALAAVAGGDIRGIEAALASGTDVNDLGCQPWKKADGLAWRELTMLTWAAENCQHEVAKFLLEQGANPNLIDDDLRPALHKAGDAQMVDLLVAHGAIVDEDIDWEKDRTALIAHACNYYNYPNIDCVRALLRHGADFTLKNFEGHTARSYAVLMSQFPLRFHTGEGWDATQGRLHETIDLLTAVEVAGSWKRYVREPVVRLLCLRYLCLASRARPPAYNTLLVRLFGAPPVPNAAKARRAASGTPLPNEVFAHILSFWHWRA